MNADSQQTESVPPSALATSYPVERVMRAVGIKSASCSTCRYLSSDDDGGDPPGASWPVCEAQPRLSCLKSFPFKKTMKCWRPEFWHSSFTDFDYEDDNAVDEALKKFRAAEASALDPDNEVAERTAITREQAVGRGD